MTKIEWVRGNDGSEGMSWNALRAVREIERGGKIVTVSANHCEHVNEACRFCYAESLNPRLGGLPFKPGHRGDYRFVVDERKLTEPLRRKKPTRIFVESMSDAFGAWWSDDQIDQIYAVMALTPQHTYVNLSKRPERRRDYLNEETKERVQIRAIEIATDTAAHSVETKWPLPNVIEGTSVSCQTEADEFLPVLKATNAAKLVVSIEPMLGPVDITPYLAHPYAQSTTDLGSPCLVCGKYTSGMHHPRAQGIDWVICGGESGPRARPMHPQWARDLRDQCARAGVAFHFKQWGEWAPMEAFGAITDGPISDKRGNVRDWMQRYVTCADRSDRLTAHSFTKHSTNLVYRVGKKRAGRLLDGVEHDGFPS